MHVLLVWSALNYSPRGEQREGCRRYGFHSRCPLGSTPAELVPRQRMVDIAQSVERRVVVADVAGSNPVIHPRERPMHARETAGSTPRPLAREKSMMEAYGSGP